MSPLNLKPALMPRMVRYGLILSLLLLAAWYLAFQARYLILGPQLSLHPEPEVVQEDRVVELRGIARNVTALSVNGRPIATDPEGNFSEAVILENGYTVLKVEARDRYGRTTELERPLVYSPKNEVTGGELSLHK